MIKNAGGDRCLCEYGGSVLETCACGRKVCAACWFRISQGKVILCNWCKSKKGKTPNLDRILADSTNALGERNILDTKLRDAVALDIAAAVAAERRAVVAWLDAQCENCETPEECEEALRDASACIDGRHHITKKEE